MTYLTLPTRLNNSFSCFELWNKLLGIGSGYYLQEFLNTVKLMFDAQIDSCQYLY